VEVLILQHPQEPDKVLGTARLTELSLTRCQLRVGLSWPNLKAALGREAQPSRWAVLYLGSGLAGTAAKTQAPGLVFVSRKGQPLHAADQERIASELEGIILLDGTWSQAKTLWWRNAWLLKLRRAILIPAARSLYGELRREPRQECLSTLESASEALAALGEPPELTQGLKENFRKLLARARLGSGSKRA
jgi:DTW domain-containing protein